MNVITDEKIVEVADEMTLRDYFAAKAMQGDLANPYDGNISEDISNEKLESLAGLYYRIADAMLKERDK